MKLQYLGDARDAFKWDLLHWICTASPFTKLVFVPLLTPDVEGSNEGRTSHHRFKCQEFIRPFLESLKEEPRTLNRIAALGTVHPEKQFQVYVFAPEKFIGTGIDRRKYWSDFDASAFENAIVFFDPDIGYETKARFEKKKPTGPEWIGHDELKNIFARLPETSVALVYQHRPRRCWIDLFGDLIKTLAYVHTAIAVHESNLAFVAMAGNVTAGWQITTAMTEYAARHPDVTVTPLMPS
jgi:hypothetical protein